MIEIDTFLLKRLGISPDEYVFMKLLYEARIDELEDIYKLLTISQEKLTTKGYLKIVNEGVSWQDYHVRAFFTTLIQTDDNKMWVELINEYPHKVPSPGGGYRILHTADPDAKSNQKLKKKYLKIVSGKSGLHQKIIAALREELRNNRNKLQYLQMLETWINNHAWEKYFVILDTKDRTSSVKKIPEAKVSYGNKLK